MKYYLRTVLIFVVLLLSFTGCAYSGSATVDKELGPDMLRLTSAVQGVAERPVDYGFPPDGSGDECIRLAVEDDPGLLSPFGGYVLKAKCEDRQAVMLLCNPKGETTLMEDAGCTTKLDFRAEGMSRTCDFSLDTTQICQ